MGVRDSALVIGLLPVLLLTSAIAGCSGKKAQAGGLELLIATNLTTPTQFDSITLKIEQQSSGGQFGAPLIDTNFLVPGETTLPTTFAVVAGKSPDQVVLIQVVALKNNQPIDLREVEVQVPTDRVAELTLILAESCIGQVTTVAGGQVASTCPGGQSCQPATGTCGSTTIPTPSATYDGGDILQVDATVGAFLRDAGVDVTLRDAGRDVHRDAGVDVTLSDAGQDVHRDAGVDATPSDGGRDVQRDAGVDVTPTDAGRDSPSDSCNSATCSCGASCRGCCSDGSCVELADETNTMCGAGGAACEPCATDNECDTAAGQCVCNSNTCPGGCCLGLRCVSYASESSKTCGTNGEACASCAAGQECDTAIGTCVCNSTTCAAGCCNGDICVLYAAQSPMQCGTGGTECISCSSPSVCSSGTCG